MQAEVCTEAESLTALEITLQGELIEKACHQYQFYASSPLSSLLTGAQKAFFHLGSDGKFELT